jgi:hypothetical protein
MLRVKVSVSARNHWFAYTIFSCRALWICLAPGKMKTRQKSPPPYSLQSNVFSPPTFSPSPFVCAPKRLASNRITRTLHPSFLQGHILPSRGPCHPRPAPRVLQVHLSQYVIDWGGGPWRPWFTHTSFSCLTTVSHLLTRILLSNVFSTPTFSPSPFVNSPRRLSSNRLNVLFITRFCRVIFCRHGGHVILDLLHLYCRYFYLNMSFTCHSLV